MDQTTYQTAFADGFHNEYACNIMAFGDHTRDDCTSIPWENMESTFCSARLADMVDTEG